MRKINQHLLWASSALCICFIATEAAARTAAYHPDGIVHSASVSAEAEAVQTNSAPQSTGMWEKTKDVTSDVWDGTKEVTSDVWDGTKKVGSDVWDGAKKMGSDVSEAVSGNNDAPTTMPSAAHTQQ